MRLPRTSGRDLQRMLPLAALGIIAIGDVLLGPEVGLLPVYAAVPALAAAWGTTRWVVANGTLAAVLCVFSAAYGGVLGHTRVYIALLAIAFVTVAAAVVGAFRRRTERELMAVRAVADTMQRVLLSPPPERAGPLAMAASYDSAARAARVGGDLYEAVVLPDRVRFVVADVQGKGLDAVRVASVVLSAFRESAPYADRLEETADRIERALGRRTDGGRFVTAVLAEVTADGGLTLLNHGHPGPLILRADGGVELAEPADPAPPLGMAALCDAAPAVYRRKLAPGDRLLLYTDGVTEARDAAGVFYPLRDRAGTVVAASGPAEALGRLRADLAEYTRAQAADDSALMLVAYDPAGERRRPGDERPDHRPEERVRGAAGADLAMRT
ncbi:PP2C family protein-serine/threonine phosphatase [Streptomyces sp. NPDC051940]|uniref:PP2C family protein-serine/threonine phosphatase n=1 Tax=Streptomyces sp. NPDC051940 TaxID=3155675 RepID=UPI00342FE586